MLPRTVIYHRAETCTAAYSSRDTVVGKQKQMLSSPPPSLSLCLSLYLILSLFLSGGRGTNNHQNFCLSHTIPAWISKSTGAVWLCVYLYGNWLFPRDALRSFQYLCSPRKDIPRLSWWWGCVCVCTQKHNQRKKETLRHVCLLKTTALKLSIWGLIPSYIRQCLLNVLGMFSVSCAQTAFRFEKQDYSLSYCYIMHLQWLDCWCVDAFTVGLNACDLFAYRY